MSSTNAPHYSRTPWQEFVENSYRTCVECSRQFDMFDEEDAQEWHYGHDCESN